MFTRKRTEKLILLCIIVLATVLRTYNIHWDQNFHLHPDERFLTMVGNAMQIPKNISTYFDTNTSPMNPENIGFTFYVYGIFPIILNKFIALVMQTDTYNLFTVQGRMLSAIFDVFTLIFVYRIGKILFSEKPRVALLGGFFYAISVLPIQLSHFFAVDTFLNTFMTGSFYFMLTMYYEKKKESYGVIALSGVLFGLALASKLSAIFLLPVLLILLFLARFQAKKLRITTIIKRVLLFGIVAYVLLRLADPYYFASSSFFSFHLNPNFLKSINELRALSTPEVWFPPSVQWIHKTPVLFSLYNLAMFGVGFGIFFCMLIGFTTIYSRKVDKYIEAQKKAKLSIFSYTMVLNMQKLPIVILALWMGVFFLYQSVQFTKTMRYFIFLYPYIALFAAVGLHRMHIYVHKKRSWGIRMIIFALILYWPIMFMSVYTRENSRIRASQWLYQHVPDGSSLLVEHWDDALPLPMGEVYNKRFIFVEFPIFGQDTEEKWRDAATRMETADYYILSSNRAYGSIMTVPERYPVTTMFYQDLFNERLQFTKVAEFTQYPRLCVPFTTFCWEIVDQGPWADEAFTVYDHQRVLIYKKI
ncbi:glycosyltransferase family 39 protein [Candidatus Woesebacteria bacterium]|nr:glycosyltransferase family 39 protein [Candidatus Woesebacteria bacterium]